MTGTRRRGGSLPRPLAGVSSNDSRASRLLELVIERIAAGGADSLETCTGEVVQQTRPVCLLFPKCTLLPVVERPLTVREGVRS